MKFSEQWLREWVNPPVNAQQLTEQFIMAGLEVESLTPVAGSFTNVVVGYVNEVTAHPDAARLRVCQVNVGQAEPLTIVCGAANVRAGLKVPVAQIGAVLPNGLKIQSTKLRGVLSQGMICSTSELGLTETSEGIMELPEEAPVGQDFRQWLQLDDQVIDIHVTPNRGDCLSIAGMARETAVLNDCDFQAPVVTPVTAQINDMITVNLQAAVECPQYFGRIIRGINANAKTPVWMVERLRRAGVRSIHPVVDVTNYILQELGQPLHAFDLAKLQGNIVVRLAKANEAIVLLDGQTVQLNEKTLVIADEQQALAIAGIMGGISSSVTESTNDIFLESAFFNPIKIAGRARSFGLDTDSAYRFERGVDPQLAAQALERATQLLLEIVGGKPGPVISAVVAEHLPKQTTVTLRESRLQRMLDTTIPVATVETILRRLGMHLTKQADGWQVIPPSYRFDLSLEEDLIEEVVRIYGYQNIPVKAPLAKLEFLPQSEQQLPLTRVRKLLVDRGYHEAITYSFVAPKMQQLLDPEHSALVLKNPISADLSVMRTNLWAGLLNAVSYNQNRQQNRLRLFESGLRFIANKDLIEQQAMLAGVITGPLLPEQWGEVTRTVDFFDLKGDIEALLALSKQAKEFSFTAAQHPALHPGQTSAIHLAGQQIGILGALHPALLQELDLQGPIYLFELQLDALDKASLPQFQAISKFPAVRRDISFLVSQKISAQQIIQLVQNTAGELLSDICLFDVYQGKNVESGFRSLALGLMWQTLDRTLVDSEINERMDQVIAALKQQFAINLRD